MDHRDQTTMDTRRATRTRKRRWRRARLFVDRRAVWRLGRLEYVLLALIGLGVGVTIAMAVIDPPA